MRVLIGFIDKQIMALKLIVEWGVSTVSEFDGKKLFHVVLE